MPILDEKESAHRVAQEVDRIYSTWVKPIEEHNPYFQGQPWTHEEITAKPQVLVLGQYSSGKTTYLRHILGKDYPGHKIGPEPTTDKFCVLLNSQGDDRITPGQTLTMNPDLPYRGLEKFGSQFMECLESSRFQCNLLNSITIVDSPGVLSAHQSKDRSYDFPGVVEWFAERSDLILFFFDPEKLDISEEMHRVIAKLNGHESKLRIILNKMDKVDELDLVKVFGSLMWSLGRCFPGADMVRVYMGCYGAPVNPQHSHNAALVQRDCALLADDLAGLVKDAPVRKVNRLVKRVRLLKVQSLLLAYMKEQMPLLLWKKEKQMEMADNLDAIYEAVQIRYDFSLGDFPDKVKFRPYLEEVDLSEVKKLKKGMIESLDMILDVEAPRLFQLLPGGVAENFEAPLAALHSFFLNGMIVLKHGRSGSAKRRLLYCNDEVTELYWTDKLENGPVFPPKGNRTIHLNNVVELRKGTELDPSNMPKLGTATLRRHCHKEDMHMCFSLILKKRTFDIQFADRNEMEMVFGNLSQHLIDLRGTGQGGCVSDDDCFSETSEAVSMASSEEGAQVTIEHRSNSLVALEGVDLDEINDGEDGQEGGNKEESVDDVGDAAGGGNDEGREEGGSPDEVTPVETDPAVENEKVEAGEAPGEDIASTEPTPVEAQRENP